MCVRGAFVFAVLLAAGRASAANPEPPSLTPKAPMPLGLVVERALRPPADEGLVTPDRLGLDDLGRLFVLDRAQAEIWRVEADSLWSRFSASEQGGPRSSRATRLCARPGTDLWALVPSTSVLERFDLDGRFLGSIRLALELVPAGDVEPGDFVLTQSGDLCLLDRAGARVLLFDREGRFLTDWSAGQAGAARPEAPNALALDREGTVWMLDPAAGLVRSWDRRGAPGRSFRFGGGLSPRASAAALLTVLDAWVVVAATDASWIRFFDFRGEFLFQGEFPTWRGVAAGDLESDTRDRLFLARAAAGEVACVRVLVDPERGPDRRP